MGLFSRQTQRVLAIVKSNKLSDGDKWKAVEAILAEMHILGAIETFGEAVARKVAIDIDKLQEELELTDDILALTVNHAGIDTEWDDANKFADLDEATREAERMKLSHKICDLGPTFIEPPVGALN